MSASTDLICFAPHIQNQIKTLLKNANVCLGRKQMVVMNPQPSCPPYMADVKCDRFKLIVSYAGVAVECMVVFHNSGPECAPDFIFADSRFFAPIDEVEDLRKWNIHNSNALYRSIKEIMQLYKKKQIMELEKYDLLSYEYLSLFQLQNFDENDIEVFVPIELENPVIFLIQLHVDFCKILSNMIKGNPSLDTVLLIVVYPSRESTRNTQRLYLMKDIEKILGLGDGFQLSSNITEHSLTQYISALEIELKNRAQHISSLFERRKMYFVKFLYHFKGCVIEYDILSFTNIVLLLEEDDFHFILEIIVTDNFPMEAPNLIFRSIYHSFMGQPIAIFIDSYPYSPAWSLDKVLYETVKFIQEYVPSFQQNCYPNCYDDVSDDDDGDEDDDDEDDECLEESEEYEQEEEEDDDPESGRHSEADEYQKTLIELEKSSYETSETTKNRNSEKQMETNKPITLSRHTENDDIESVRTENEEYGETSENTEYEESYGTSEQTENDEFGDCTILQNESDDGVSTFQQTDSDTT